MRSLKDGCGRKSEVEETVCSAGIDLNEAVMSDFR